MASLYKTLLKKSKGREINLIFTVMLPMTVFEQNYILAEIGQLSKKVWIRCTNLMH